MFSHASETHAEASHFHRGLGQAQPHYTKARGRLRREVTAHDGFLHDFVLVAVAVIIQKPVRPTVGIATVRTVTSGIEPGPIALSCRSSPFHPAARPTKC